MGFWLILMLLLSVVLDSYVNCSNLDYNGFGDQRRAIPGKQVYDTRTRTGWQNLEVSISQSNSSEADLLLQFRDGVTQDPNSVFMNWNGNTSSYCNWAGVMCDNQTGRVIGLNLTGQQLAGSISSSLGSLQFLSSLDLSNNSFSGIIPSSLSMLQNLSYLDLSTNAIQGGIPASISNCSSLKVLSLSFNYLSGTIPSTLGFLGSLKYLYLDDNALTGFIPPSIGNCKSLIDLDLQSNQLSDIIPIELGSLQNLRYLSLRYNNLSGHIPRELGNLQNLQFLFLATNNLSGPVPVSLFNCSLLQYVIINNNQLSGEVSEDFGKLPLLQKLYLWGNNLAGFIPASLANCSFLTDLDLRDNRLIGEIPQDLGKLTTLVSLYLNSNFLDGAIPASLGNCSTLQEVVLDANQFSGQIPAELGSLKSLTKLEIGSNNLTGMIPSTLGNCSSLLSLYLSRNQLTGIIPTSLRGLTQLQGLNLSYNRLQGGIPIELSSCSHLSVLDLSSNILMGNIPDELGGGLLNLNKLYLNNNYLGGSMTSALSLGMHKKLLELNLAHNYFGGPLAADAFMNLQNLQIILDLSHNLVSGFIPSGVGALVSVQKVDFSFNNISGAIPDTFSSCVALESLDLSSNHLEGAIPKLLTSVKHLGFLNLSNNALSGPIPTFNLSLRNESFLGNPGLCGSVINQECKEKASATCHGIRCHRAWIIALPAACVAIFCLAIVAVFCVCLKKRSHLAVVTPGVPSVSHFSDGFQNLTVGEIMAATNGFNDSNIVGLGSKSTVYAGCLSGGLIIAVKKLQLANDKSTFEFYREIQRLTTFKHPNLLTIHALLSTPETTALVTEHVSNGSLRSHLYRDDEACVLTWDQRLDIAIGLAEAMVYLHHAASKPVLHLDLKPGNILLDVKLRPKVADYGIARFLCHESRGVEASLTSSLYGTVGYIPPEYGSSTSVSTRGDVYNFGVVLMEILTRKQPTDDMFGHELSSLRSWVLAAFPNRISQILDMNLQNELVQNPHEEQGINVMVRLALTCTQNASKDRPTMIQARDILMEVKLLQHTYKGQLWEKPYSPTYS